MTGRDHNSYSEEVGAYLLGALTDLERQAFERHMAGCGECRDEVERLRPAADALPRSVEQVEPPPALKASMMEIVEREAREAAGDAPVPKRSGPSLRERLFPRGGGFRPALAAAALLLGLALGFGVAQFGGEDDAGRNIAATVDEGRIPQASGSLSVEGEGESGAILRVQGLPALDEQQVYQAWVQRGGTIVPQPTFEVEDDGGGAVAVTEDLSGADAVLVTREPRGGARAPSERPIMNVPL